MTATMQDARACHARSAEGSDDSRAGPRRIAYLVSRFPKLTETFVLYELLAIEKLGEAVSLYPLQREHQSVRHPEAEAWTQRAHWVPFLSLGVLRAHLHYLWRKPAAYVRVLHEVLRGTWGSMKFFGGAVAFFPKAVRMAFDMEREGVTHVHAHFCSHPALVALIIHRLTGIPFSFTAHGSDLHVDRRMLDRKVEACSFAIAISEFNRQVILGECADDAGGKVRVIHCGVDMELFAPKPAVRDAGPLRLLCVASFEEVKGHRYLVEACAMLRDRGVEFVCELVGEGPLRAEIEALISRHELGDRVRVLGGRARPDVLALYRKADIAVLASRPTSDGRKEGIPVVLMEAMASGLPVVSTAISGIPELVDRESGILVAPADATALADALTRLALDEELRSRMGEYGRLKVEREFDLRVNARRLLELFGVVQPDTPHQTSFDSRGSLPYDAAAGAMRSSHAIPQ
jgi:colanic acid/amylovoran biosynthesis glycosyltransferase